MVGRGKGPLRRVTHVTGDDVAGFDYLECGHRVPSAQDHRGRRYPLRRRCARCLKRPSVRGIAEAMAEQWGTAASGQVISERA